MSDRVAVPALLRALGVRFERSGHKYVGLCPNPAHPDRRPSWSMLDDGSHHCFSCGFGGGPWELVAAVRGCTLAEAGAWLRERVSRDELTPAEIPRVKIRQSPRGDSTFELPAGVQIPSLDGTSWFVPAAKYLAERRVPEWQLERWHVGFATRGRCAFRVVVPVHTQGRLVSYVARAFVDDGRPRYDVARRSDPGARPDLALFGEPAFDDTPVVTVAEGVFSMLALERAGAPNPCAVLGAENLGSEKRDMLARFDLALIATDPDRAGEQAYEELRAALCRYVEVRRLVLSCSPDDASEDELRGVLEVAW